MDIEPLLPIAAEKNSLSSQRKNYPSGYLDTNTKDVSIPIITTPYSPSYVNHIVNLNEKGRIYPRRCHSAPPVFTDTKEAFFVTANEKPSPESTVRTAFIGLVLYMLSGVLIYMISGSFKGHSTLKPVDALYFTVVTLCTIGYGDIVPDTTLTKLSTCVFLLVGFGFIGILLNGMVTYICDKQEQVLLSSVDEGHSNSMVQAYIINKEKGRMRIRMKVFLASAVVIGCIAIGTVTVRYLEKMTWVDSFYLSVISVTTVGYGDYTFTTLGGRCFAIVWLLVSTFAVARAFLTLAELSIDKRNRRIAKWVLQKKITLGDLVAADLDNDGSISKSEFIIYKLKEMGKVAEKDILEICKQFDLLAHSNSSKITIADLMITD